MRFRPFVAGVVVLAASAALGQVNNGSYNSGYQRGFSECRDSARPQPPSTRTDRAEYVDGWIRGCLAAFAGSGQQAGTRQQNSTQAQRRSPSITVEEAKRIWKNDPQLERELNSMVSRMRGEGRSEDEIRVSVLTRVEDYRARKSGGQMEAFQAEGIEPFHAQDVEPNRSRPVDRDQYSRDQHIDDRRDRGTRRSDDAQQKQPAEQASNSQPPRSSSGTGSFFRTFGLAIPGVAYSVDNYATNTTTLHTSTGAVTNSAVRINTDHTYDWSSQWDGKLIHGRWVERDGGILLQRGQEGKDWLMQRMARPLGKAEVTLWDQNSIYYHGTPL